MERLTRDGQLVKTRVYPKRLVLTQFCPKSWAETVNMKFGIFPLLLQISVKKSFLGNNKSIPHNARLAILWIVATKNAHYDTSFMIKNSSVKNRKIFRINLLQWNFQANLFYRKANRIV